MISYRATIDNLGKDGIPQEVRDEFIAIPAKQIEVILPAAFKQDIPAAPPAELHQLPLTSSTSYP